MEAMSNHGPDLAAAACLAGWPTPTANAKDQVETRRGLQTLGGSALLSGWPSPTACDSNRKPSQDFKTPNITLNHAAVLSGWPTPNAGTPQSLRGNGQDPEIHRSQGHQVNLKDAVRYLMHDHPVRLTACGQMLTGSSAGMESGGQLSPEHPRWLMGLPAEWDVCAPTETPSMLKRRRTS
jgi:hypothetical protein